MSTAVAVKFVGAIGEKFAPAFEADEDEGQSLLMNYLECWCEAVCDLEGEGDFPDKFKATLKEADFDESFFKDTGDAASDFVEELCHDVDNNEDLKEVTDDMDPEGQMPLGYMTKMCQAFSKAVMDADGDSDAFEKGFDEAKKEVNEGFKETVEQLKAGGF